MLHEYINKSPFLIKGAIIKPISKKLDKKIDALTIEEQQRLEKQLKISNDPFVDIFYIALYTGMRVGEILALCSDDIKEDKIIVTKTLTRNADDKYVLGNTTKTYAGQREIPIINDLKPIIYKLLPKTDYWFKIDFQTFASPILVNAHFKRVCKDAEIRIYKTNSSKLNKNGDKIQYKSSQVNTHMLRHTFATRCIEAGMSPVVLQKILGHKNIEVTLNTYTSVFDKYKQKEIDKLEEYLNGLH